MGSYDGEPVYRAVAEHQPDPPVAVVVPPRASAVPSLAADTTPTQRDQHLRMIRDKGRLGWQKAVGYGRRSLGETAVFRYKAIIGRESGKSLGLCGGSEIWLMEPAVEDSGADLEQAVCADR